MAMGDISPVRDSKASTASTLAISCTGGTPYGVALSCLAFRDGSGGMSGTAFRMLNGSNALLFDFYSDAALTKIWGNTTNLSQYPPPIISTPLDSTGAGFSSTPIYAAVEVPSTAVPGLYTDEFSGGSTALRSIMQSDTVKDCNSSQAVTRPPVFVSANITKDCVLSADDLDFGQVGMLSETAPLAASNKIRVTCSSGVRFALAIDAGSSPGATLDQRLLTDRASGSSIKYQIYTSAGHNEVWGNGTGNTVAQSGSGTGQAVSYDAFGEVPAQGNPQAGTYLDTLVVTVMY
ncbi:hypothetical protein JCM19000A_40060 [Silvimonas sp. JCM 19000]